MSTLEYFASLSILAVTIGYVVAWESDGRFSHHLRKQVRLTGWLLLGLAKKPVGWTLGAATLVALLFAPRNHALRFYRQRRTWVPEHSYSA